MLTIGKESMLRWLFKFCRGQTDVNENHIPDNEEVMRALEILMRKMEDPKLARK